MARARETQGMGDIGVEARASAPDMRPANETIATVRENYPIADVAEALWDVSWRYKWQEKDHARLIEENARLREALEERRDEDVPGWVTEWPRPDFQRAGEELDELCRKWTERQQKGELDLDKIEQFFEEAERWSPVVEPGLIAEARQLVLTGQVRVDPNIDPNNLLSAEFLGLLDRLFSTGKLGSAWSRWINLQEEFLAEAEAREEIDAKVLEERRTRLRALRVIDGGRAGAA